MAGAERLFRSSLVAVVLASLCVGASTTSASAEPTWRPTVDVGSAIPTVDHYDLDQLHDGTTAVVWGERDDETAIVYFATRGPGDPAFSPKEQLSSGDARNPQVVVATDGTVIVAWIQGADGDTVEVTGLEPGAAEWSTPETVSSPSVASFELVVDVLGSVTVVSSHQLGFDAASSTYRVDANAVGADGSWSDQQLVAAESTEHVVDLSAVVDAAGRVTVVWAQGAGLDRRVHAASPDETGGYVDTTLGGGDVVGAAPDVAATPGGGVAVSWSAQVTPDWEVAVVSTREPGAAFFSDRESVAGPQMDVLDTEVVVDDLGTITVLFAAVTYNEYAVFASTRPPGDAFSAQLLAATLGVALGELEVASAPDRAVTALWQVGEADSLARVQAAHRVAGGDFVTPAIDLAPADDPDTADDDATHVQPAVAVDASGDATVVWAVLRAGPANQAVRSRVLDAAGPVVGQVVVPATATPGSTVSLSVSATDHWSGPANVAWSFGDGGTATGASTSHSYAAGTYQVTVTATDAVGNVTTVTRPLTVAAPSPLPPAPPLGDRVAPVLSGARVAPKALPAGRAAMLRVTSSEPAKLAGVVRRRDDGRWQRVGAKQWSVKAGANSVKLYGKAAQPRLAPGKYRLRLIARDPAGNASITVTTTFRVARS